MNTIIQSIKGTKTELKVSGIIDYKHADQNELEKKFIEVLITALQDKGANVYHGETSGFYIDDFYFIKMYINDTPVNYHFHQTGDDQAIMSIFEKHGATMQEDDILDLILTVPEEMSLSDKTKILFVHCIALIDLISEKTVGHLQKYDLL